MRITSKWIKKWRPCKEAVDFVGNERDSDKILQKLLDGNKLDWANWFIVRIMTYEQYVKYAIFAAEQVIDIWAKKYPNNDLPQKAIIAARLCLTHPTMENRIAARAAALAAVYAADAATLAALAAADAAAYEARAAARVAARAAVYAADAAAYEAYEADAAAYEADAAAREAALAAADNSLFRKIIDYGIDLLEAEVQK